MISSVAIFVLGSGICGGATSTPMLIVGRGIQGIGAGGINMLVDIIICDLVPLRERGTKVGMLFAIIATVSSVGPLVGGALAQNNAWRWVFYLNLPVGGFAIVLLFLFLRVSYQSQHTFKQQMARVDFIGNGILIASTTLILYVLTYAGSRYSWGNPQMVALLVVGLVSLVGFGFFERTKFARDPVIPPRLFGNRTSVAAYFISFMHSLLSIWATYFFPLYFQSVLGSTPTRSGVQLLPLVFVFPAFAAIAGGFVSKTGRYRPVHAIGLAVLTVSIGCCSLLDQNSHMAVWVILELLVGAGLGSTVSALLPAVQAGLTEADTATSTATWAFIRSLGTIWGVSIPAAVFNNRFDQLSYRVTDASIRAQLTHGQAYEHASKQFLDSVDSVTRDQLVGIYADSLKRSWQVGIIFAGISFLAVFFEKEVKLRTELDTKFGLENQDTKQAEKREGEIEKAEMRRRIPRTVETEAT